MARQVYINLPVKQLERSIDFFTRIGFSLNPQFSDDTAACIIIDQNLFVMLLTEAKFAGFTPNPVCDARQSTEVLVCLGCDSRAEVDAMVQKALAAGGNTYKEPEDHGFMYGHGFQDPDGHIWELIHMDVG
ncbi:VOC family protein [Marinobacterium aestuariivivens]|uniref:VOC family protein n=1 Tax=Marinobacterium aestuariivivens TaxID=1698799 RepID=A0ABW2A6N2_9GAMM